MKDIIYNYFKKVNFKLLSSLATFALVVTSYAANQQCWFMLHEEKLSNNYKKLRKF